MSIEQIRATTAITGDESPDPLLSIENLTIGFEAPGGRELPVLQEISLGLPQGRILALVGESGSGKSTLARSVTGTLARNGRISSGTVRFAGRDLSTLTERDYRRLRGRRIGYVPQDALLGLNPLLPVGVQAEEPLRAHGMREKKARRTRVLSLFARVGLPDPENFYHRYPHELSGGQCQRVLIAAAISANPRLIVADEPTTALDVTVQRKILDLLSSLVREKGLSVLLITHDLGLAGERADDIAVLKEGRLVESGTVQQILYSPRQQYTRELIRSASQLTTTTAARPAVENPLAPADPQENAVQLDSVTKTFTSTRSGHTVTALDDVNLTVAQGTTLGIVGESGSGKTTLVRILTGLTAPDSGTVTVAGEQVVHHRSGARNRLLYKTLQLIYQNPYASLNPRSTVRSILEEPLTGFGLGDRKSRAVRVGELLELTGLPSAIGARYTAELSGGQRQRVAIARALAPNPRLLICDEPVSALDVTVQRQILDLLVALQRELGLTYVFISHDLGVIGEVSDSVLVLEHGKVVEEGPASQILSVPKTAYVGELLAAIPRPPHPRPLTAAGESR